MSTRLFGRWSLGGRALALALLLALPFASASAFENTVRIRISPERQWQCGATFFSTGGQALYQITRVYANDQFIAQYDHASAADCAKVVEHVTDVAPNTRINITTETGPYRFTATFTGTDRNRIWTSGFFVDHNNGELTLDFAPARSRAFAASPELSGQAPMQTLQAILEVAGTDAGKTGGVFLVATDGVRLFALVGTTWAPVTTNLTPWKTTLLTDRIVIPVFTNLDVRLLHGVAVFAGYGSSAADMLERRQYRLVAAF